MILEAATLALRAAVTAALDKMPGLRIALGGLADQLIIATESLAGTKLGQGIAKAEAGILKGYDKAKGMFGKGPKTVLSSEKGVRFAKEMEKVVPSTSETINFSRELRPEDLGVTGHLEELRGRFSMTDKTATVRIDMVKGEIDNTIGVINNLSRLARSNGAEILKIEGTFANDDLLSVLSRRYKSKMVSEGANEIITIPLK